MTKSQGKEIPVTQEEDALFATVAIPATDENLAKAEASLPSDSASLAYAISVHEHLAPRLEAHLARIRAWDLRKLGDAQRIQVTGATADLAADFDRLGYILSRLQEQGFVPHTTPSSRKASRLTPGARVRLDQAKRQEYAQLFSSEQLDNLEVMSVAGKLVKLRAGDGTVVGAFLMSHVNPVKQ